MQDPLDKPLRFALSIVWDALIFNGAASHSITSSSRSSVPWILTRIIAVTHLASTTPNLDYACDTHWPWKRRDEDVVVPGALKWEDGGVLVTTTPGLGVELDREKLEVLHQQYLSCGLRKRDDTTYMKRFQPDFSSKLPRW